MSGCGWLYVPSSRLIVTRDIAPGDVIREGDLKIVRSGKRPFNFHDDWGWADASDRADVIGHRSKIAMDAGWPFYMSEIEQ